MCLRRPLLLLWLCCLLFLIAVILFPVSTRLTRAAGLALFGAVWLGAIVLFWRRLAVRLVLLTLSAALCAFLLWPDRPLPPVASLRADYLAALDRYDGCRYHWGGENSRGIDCSGLIRRGMIDALLTRGVREFHPTLAREGIRVWWNDCTAAAFGKGDGGVTKPITQARSINSLDHGSIQPGDLAITGGGAHILAYVGDETWIQADPIAARVIRVKARESNNGWLYGPVTITRWALLAGD